MEKTLLIDTHRAYKILEGANMDKTHAEAIVKVLSEGISPDTVVTQTHLKAALADQTLKIVLAVIAINGLLFGLLKLTA